ncbi:hypothetical protein [Mammaliicoccus sciuri]|uniref:hypothetical protein n=1 Tax=Mammaliicoccus sciuri TaxID=1296 RepID=UPI001C4F2D13|nr:hypothetical protein [Mammaliicoccus sciuri]
MKNNIGVWFVYIIVGTIGLSLLIAIGITKFSWFSWSLGDANGWLGFWGSFLGGIIGTLGVLYVAYIQNEQQRKYLNNQNRVDEQKVIFEFKKEAIDKVTNIILNSRLNIYNELMKIEENSEIIEDNLFEFKVIKHELSRILNSFVEVKYIVPRNFQTDNYTFDEYINEITILFNEISNNLNLEKNINYNLFHEDLMRLLYLIDEFKDLLKIYIQKELEGIFNEK